MQPTTMPVMAPLGTHAPPGRTGSDVESGTVATAGVSRRRPLGRRWASMLAKMCLALATAMAAFLATAAPASASASTCIQTSGPGIVCTAVDGSGTWVNHVQSQFFTQDWICNYSAWFYYVPPSGGAFGYGYQSRAGCSYGAAYFQQNVNRSFARGTLICAKFMKDYGTPVGEKCVGLS